MEKQEDKSLILNKDEIIKKAFKGFGTLYILLALLFFIPAGTLLYWEAWLYIFTFLILMIFATRYLVKNDLELLNRRLQKNEKREKQKIIIKINNFLFLIGFSLPGFDKRFGWSNVNYIIVIIMDIIFIFGYLMFFWVLRTNSYASRIIEVEENQKVISTGPYAYVRHPMYLGALIIYIASPIILGSYWSLLPILFGSILVILRIIDEEKTLIVELEGYKEYKEKVKYRLVPGLW